MIRYETHNIVTNGLCVEDIEYLRRQVLTGRSVISEQGHITENLSMLYEATKTMLTVVEFLLPICDITDIKVVVDDGIYQHDMKCRQTASAYVRFEGTINYQSWMKAWVDITDKLDIHTDIVPYATAVMHHLLKGCITFAPVNHLADYSTGDLNDMLDDDVYAYEDVYDIVSTDNEILAHINKVHRLNSNGVMAYSENYEMPSLYQNWFVNHVIGEVVKYYLYEIGEGGPYISASTSVLEASLE